MGDAEPTITTGIDLASQDADSAICRIRWLPGRAEVLHPDAAGATNSQIEAALGDASGSQRVGVDCPFGWPDHFVDAIAAHRDRRHWPDRGRLGPDSIRNLRYRKTDLEVQRLCGLWPRSVSSELLAIVAMRWAGLLDAARVSETDPPVRDGTGPIVEVYPAAALKRWGLPYTGYKGKANHTASRLRRFAILWGLLDEVTQLEMNTATAVICLSDVDALDAFVCALVARAAAVGAVEPVPDESRDHASREGWIAMPARDALSQLITAS